MRFCKEFLSGNPGFRRKAMGFNSVNVFVQTVNRSDTKTAIQGSANGQKLGIIGEIEGWRGWHGNG